MKYLVEIKIEAFLLGDPVQICFAVFTFVCGAGSQPVLFRFPMELFTRLLMHSLFRRAHMVEDWWHKEVYIYMCLTGVVETLCDWVEAGLDFDQALAQEQPVYKVFYIFFIVYFMVFSQ